MRTKLLVAFAVFASLAGLSYSGAADLLLGHHCDGGHNCHCPMVETWEWQDVVCHRCKLVEDKKPIKKTVYEVKEVPFCLTKLPKCGHCGHCDECRECDSVRYKRVLIKKEITCGETCSVKCIPEEFVERRQVKVCRPACQCQDPVQAPAAKVVIPAPVLVEDEPAPIVPAPASAAR
jgi:hypothetical protein